MKKRGRIILALTLLCGCAGSRASNPPSSSKADLATALPEETQGEQTTSQWNEKTVFIEKNYLNVVSQRYASGYYKYYYGDFEVEEIDGGLRLSHEIGKLIVEFPYEGEILFHFFDRPIPYIKNE